MLLAVAVKKRQLGRKRDPVRRAKLRSKNGKCNPGVTPQKRPRLVTEAKCLIRWCRCPESNWGPTHYECEKYPIF